MRERRRHSVQFAIVVLWPCNTRALLAAMNRLVEPIEEARIEAVVQHKPCSCCEYWRIYMVAGRWLNVSLHIVSNFVAPQLCVGMGLTTWRDGACDCSFSVSERGTL